MRSRLYLGGLFAGFALLLAAAPLKAANDHVNKAIDKGVAGLKQLGPKEGGGRRYHVVGSGSLIGLTLLECGVPEKDAVVQKLAADIRPACVELTHTYSLALAIMFLDHLGNETDRALIQSMAVRLLAGQNSNGGWTYNCPRPSAEEVARLTNYIRSPGVNESAPKRSPKDKVELPREIKAMVDAINKGAMRGDADAHNSMGDNSNTQFALMGLWISRRHGMPVDRAMARLEVRFRNSQHGDGGWGYVPSGKGPRGQMSTASMTCAGMLALAVSHGAVNEAALRADPTLPAAKLPRHPARDPAVKAGLLALGTAVGIKQGNGRGQMPRGPVMQKGYYALWSLERVAVAYSLPTIGNKDWYGWGCEMLLASQAPDGTWQGEHGPEIDTCFALLFLRRVNLAQDLTASLKGVQDPGEVTLKAGGIGGEGLLAKGVSSGIEFGDKPATDSPRSESSRLAQEYVQAPAEKQRQLLKTLKDAKGAVHTDALALLIPQLEGEARNRARDALAERLARMTAATLRDKLQDEEPEVRRAAAIACAMKEDRGHIPDLIAVLEDKEFNVVKAARAALKSLTAKDFGPASDATDAQRARAVADWKAWWKTQSK